MRSRTSARLTRPRRARRLPDLPGPAPLPAHRPRHRCRRRGRGAPGPPGAGRAGLHRRAADGAVSQRGGGLLFGGKGGAFSCGNGFVYRHGPQWLPGADLPVDLVIGLRTRPFAETCARGVLRLLRHELIRLVPDLGAQRRIQRLVVALALRLVRPVAPVALHAPRGTQEQHRCRAFARGLDGARERGHLRPALMSGAARITRAAVRETRAVLYPPRTAKASERTAKGLGDV